MAAQLPRAESLYFYGMAVFDTGVVFDFETRANEAAQSAALLKHLRARHPEYEWFNEGASYQIAGAVDNYAPPKVNSILAADVTNAFERREFTLRVPRDGRGDLTIDCRLSDLRADFYLFNAGLLHFRLDLPPALWTDAYALERVRYFIQLHTQPLEELGLNLEGLLGPTIARLRAALSNAIAETNAPLLRTPYLDFTVASGEAQVRWSHPVIVALMPEPFDPDGDHFQPVLLDLNPEGITNFARHKHHFAYVEAGDSLVCVPAVQDMERSPEEAAYENWIRWIIVHQYTWKMAWELDRALYAVLSAATGQLKRKRSSGYRDVYALNALLNFIWLLIDTHKPRNMTSAAHSIHFLEQIAASWRTDEILAAAEEKMAALRDLIGQLDELSDNRRGRRVEVFLTFLGVVSLGSLVLDLLGTLSIGQALGDVTVLGLVTGVVAAVMLLAYVVLR